MEIIKEADFRRQLKSGLSGAYLFFGDEDYMKNFSLQNARKTLCPDPTLAIFNDIQIDPLEYSPEGLIDALAAMPMMEEKKIVSINGLSIAGMKPYELEPFIEAVGAIKEYDYNVLIVLVPFELLDKSNSVKGTQKILSALSKVMTPVQFDAVTGARLTEWVKKHLEHHGVTASANVCNTLIEKCSRSMFTLSKETEKLAFYVLAHQRKEVTEADVELVSCSVISSEAYALANAILDGRYADALDALNVMKFKRIDPIVILGELSRSVCDLFYVKVLQEDGAPISEIARILNVKEFRAKIYANATASKSRESFERAIRLCSEADLSLKRASQGYSAIERLICYL